MKHQRLKNISWALFFAFVTMVGAVNSQSKEVNFEETEVRDEIRYLTGEQVPFSGVAVARYPSGNMALEAIFRDGIQHGLEIGWYRSGQLKHEIIYRSGQPQTLGSKWYEDKPETRKNFLLCSETEKLDGFCDKSEAGKVGHLEPCIEGEKCDEDEPEGSSTFKFCTDEAC